MEPDEFVKKWRAGRAREERDDVMDTGRLTADSFCVVFDMRWGGAAGGLSRILAPEYFESPVDFIAWLRAVELPRSLRMLCGEGHVMADAEAYLPCVPEHARDLLEQLIATLDELLGLRAGGAGAAGATAPSSGAGGLGLTMPDESDARRAVAAYNALFGRRDDAEFVACGDLAAVFAAPRIREQLLTPAEGGEEGSVEAARALLRLVDEGTFDAHDPAQLHRARRLLARFPAV